MALWWFVLGNGLYIGSRVARCDVSRQWSLYGGYTWNLLTPNAPLINSVALTAALATGYPNTIYRTDISLLLIPSARIKVSPLVGLRLTLLPYVRRYKPATSVHFSIEQAF